MTKMLNVLSKANVPMAGFIIFTLYSVIAGFSIGSSIASFAFAGLYAYRMFLDDRDERGDVDTILEKVKRLEDTVSAIKMANGFKLEQKR